MKLKMSIIAILCGLSLVGCTNNNVDNSSNKQEPIKNQEQSSTDNNSKDDDKNKPNKPVDENNEDKADKENSTSTENKESEFKIYTMDSNDTNKKIEFLSFKMDESMSLEEKLNELCIILQKDYFKEGNAKIRLENIDNDKIATINLVNEVPGAWDNHFAGSTGGLISQNTIIETILQRDYNGEWIKGVKVTIDGKDSQDIYDHAPFGEVFYR